jgi:hypothetical protein
MDQQYALALDYCRPGQTLTCKMPLRQTKSRVAGFVAGLPANLRLAPAEKLPPFEEISRKKSCYPALDFSHSYPDF